MGAQEGDVAGQLGSDLAQLPLGGDVKPIAGLDLQMRDAGAQGLGPSPTCQLSQLARARRAGRIGGDPDAARLVWLPGQPRGELLRSVSREDQMRVTVDEARNHAATRGVDAAVGGRAPPLHGGDTISIEHEGRPADDPQRPFAEGGVVGDQQADVLDRQ